MKSVKSGTVAMGIALLLVLSVIGGSATALFAAQPAPRYGGILRLTDMQDGVSIGVPAKLVRVYGLRQVSPAVETLFRTDKSGKPVPYLVAASKEDAKGKTITLTLKKGIKFHDDTDFNAEAVKWNLEQCMAAKTAGSEKFKSVDAIDAATVRINLTEWDSTVTSSFAQTLGLMISPTAYKKNGEEWAAKNPVGTGAFQFVSWEKDSKTVYKKFPGYWQKGKPYLDRIEWIPILDNVTRQLALVNNEVDLAATIAAKDVADLTKKGFVISRQGPPSGVLALVPSSADPKSPWSDVRVRRAAQYAIRGKTLVSALFYNEGEPTNQFIYKSHWGYNPSVVGYPYNVEKARKLLAEAGYPNGFKTTLHYRTSPADDLTFTAVQGYLRAVGINVEMDAMQQGRFTQIAWDGGKWEGLILSREAANADLTGLLAQSFAGGGKLYSQMLVPDDYKNAIQKAVTAPDFSTKQKWTREAMKLMTDKYCLQIILLARSDATASKPALHNHGYYAVPNTGLWTPEEAWLEK